MAREIVFFAIGLYGIMNGWMQWTSPPAPATYESGQLVGFMMLLTGVILSAIRTTR